VAQIRDQAAAYVVTVKANQPTLADHLHTAFATADAAGWNATSPDDCATLDDGHGRIEQRQWWVLADSHARTLGWQDCQTLVRIRRRFWRDADLVSDETRYYISSLPPQASLLPGAIRAHGGIENRCHWVLDVVFGEDASRTRLRNADDKLAVLRKIALNLLRQHPAKGSLKGKRYRAAVSDDFLLEVLRPSFNLMR
jgi:predicted transposase YbfD/YdcC